MSVSISGASVTIDGGNARELRNSGGSASSGTGSTASAGQMGCGSVVGQAASVTQETLQQVEGMRQEITRLKCDKLDLLRQNVVSRDWVDQTRLRHRQSF